MDSSKVMRLFTSIPAGEPVTSRRLAALGISADLAVAYVRSGWLTRLARGVFCRAGDRLDLGRSLGVLREPLAGLHVGARTALAWQGMTPAVAPPATSPPPLTLYGWDTGELPEWFTTPFPATYHRKRIIRENPDWPLHVAPLPAQAGSAPVSEPERAFLELLSEVGVRATLDDARDVARAAVTLRAAVLQSLLALCSSVKTVRLCLMLGREFDLPWSAKLDPVPLPQGSARAWVSRSAQGLLVLPAAVGRKS